VTKASRRFYRTTLLGLAAMGVLIWAAMDQFGISRGEMTQLFVGTLVAAGVTIVLAGLMALLWVGLRKLLRRDEE
jgi:hypothetical protein